MYVGVPNTIFVCGLAARSHLRDTEIHDFHDAILREHDVRRLDVTMDDALLMGIVQSVRDGGQSQEDLVDRHQIGFSCPLFQGGSLDEFHRDIPQVVFFPCVIDGHDVGVGETSGGFCFTEKPCLDVLQLVVVVDLIESHGLDGYETLDRWIFSQVDQSHRTASEFF